MIRITIDQTGIGFFRYDPHLFIGIFESMCQTSFSNVSFAPAKVVVFHLVHVFLADNKHFREVVFPLSHTK